MEMTVLDVAISPRSAFEPLQYKGSALGKERSEEKIKFETPAAGSLCQGLVQPASSFRNSASDSGNDMRRRSEFKEKHHLDPDYACTPAQLAAARCAWDKQPPPFAKIGRTVHVWSNQDCNDYTLKEWA